MLTIVWHLLSDPDASYHDHGADCYEAHLNRDNVDEKASDRARRARRY